MSARGPWAKENSKIGLRGRNTHNVDTLVSGNANLGALGTEIYADNRHCDGIFVCGGG